MAMTHPAPSASDLDAGDDYVTSSEALGILGVKPQTLYSYVSRGLIRRREQPSARASLYNRQDIARLKARSLARSGHGPAAASAMHWGEPVLATAITEITLQGPRYRDTPALDLAAADRAFEAVATYLWTGTMPVRQNEWRNKESARPVGAAFANSSGLQLCQLLTQTVQLIGRPKPHDGHAPEDLALGPDIIRAMAGTFGWLGRHGGFVAFGDGESVAHILTRALGVPTHRETLRALNAALVLVADHELTPPTFVARIAASVGSELPACIVAALQVHFGSVLGLSCDRLEQVVGQVQGGSHRLSEINPAVARMRSSPGFAHPLYAHGDPRARMLLTLAGEVEAHRGVVDETLAALEQVLPKVRDEPQLCDGLVVLARALGLPAHAAGGLLALGRSAGWIAHVIEQRAQGFIIRPRGRFEAHADESGV
jgi:citrate synthase